jgi:hypothetical protein
MATHLVALLIVLSGLRSTLGDFSSEIYAFGDVDPYGQGDFEIVACALAGDDCLGVASLEQHYVAYDVTR